MSKNDLIKSPLNYTGGKYKLLPQILPLLPENIDTFVDMFCGGCNVGVNVEANRIIFNDFMPQLIELFQKWKEEGVNKTIEYIEDRVKEFNLSKTNQEGFLKIRDEYNKNRDIRDLFVIIAHAFNHQIRFNSKGEYNMPFGKDRSEWNGTMKKNLISFITILLTKKCYFTNKSFEELKIDNLKENDFVYADPPYLITCASYNENGGWNEKQEYKLLEVLDKCNERNIKFALSNVLENKGKKNTILIDWTKKNNYNIHHLNMTYSNCNYHALDKSSGTTDEVLITNY